MKEKLYDIWLNIVVWLYITYRILKVIVIISLMILGFCIAYLSPVCFLSKLNSVWWLPVLYMISLPIGIGIILWLAIKVDWDILLKFDK